jgi:hypothetical protein
MLKIIFKSTPVLVLLLLALPLILAFAPSRFISCHVGNAKIIGSTHLKMGIFDFFSEEARQARKEAEEARKREEEEAFREMMERRRNPEKMEEYEAEVAVRRENYKRMKSKLEQQQEDFYIDENK